MPLPEYQLCATTVESTQPKNVDVFPLQFNTVIVEPDEARLVLVWREVVNVHGKVHEIGQVRVEL